METFITAARCHWGMEQNCKSSVGDDRSLLLFCVVWSTGFYSRRCDAAAPGRPLSLAACRSAPGRPLSLAAFRSAPGRPLYLAACRSAPGRPLSLAACRSAPGRPSSLAACRSAAGLCQRGAGRPVLGLPRYSFSLSVSKYENIAWFAGAYSSKRRTWPKRRQRLHVRHICAHLTAPTPFIQRHVDYHMWPVNPDAASDEVGVICVYCLAG